MRFAFITATVLALSACNAQATIISVLFDPDNVADGMGSGVLNGTNLVTYTVPAIGTTFAPVPNFAMSQATNGVPISNPSSGAAIGINALSTQPVTFNFSQTIVDPIFFHIFSDPGTSFDFGLNSLTFLDSNNAVLTGNVVSFPTAADSGNDGFAAQINGTFGPGTPLTFNYINTSGAFRSSTVTIAFATPEPSTLAIAGVGAILGLGLRWRRKIK